MKVTKDKSTTIHVSPDLPYGRLYRYEDGELFITVKTDNDRYDLMSLNSGILWDWDDQTTAENFEKWINEQGEFTRVYGKIELEFS